MPQQLRQFLGAIGRVEDAEAVRPSRTRGDSDAEARPGRSTRITQARPRLQPALVPSCRCRNEATALGLR